MNANQKKFLKGENDPYHYAVHYQSLNPVSKMLIGNFMKNLSGMVNGLGIKNIFEVGCGEGYVAMHLAACGYKVHGGDYRAEAIEEANRMAQKHGLTDKTRFEVMDIYNYAFEDVKTDLVVCCEVFEHLPDPGLALKRMAAIDAEYFLFSVPGEPLWRIMNMLRLKYIKDLGNTPGHINHWTYRGFPAFLATRFKVVKCAKPLPWNMVLCQKNA